jgi:hypothetical protein
MGIAGDIEKLGEDIVSSYDSRIKAIGTLVRDTHQMLKGFDAEHKEMSEKLSAELAKGEEDRIKEAAALLKKIQEEHKAMADEIKDTLERFDAEHKEMSEKLSADLAKGETERLKGETERLKEFKSLKAEIEKYVDDVVKTTKRLMDEIRKRQKERNAQVADLLEAYNTERERMAANWQAMTATMAERRVENQKGGEFKEKEEVAKV